MKKLILAAAATAAFLGVQAPAWAAGGKTETVYNEWSFQGIFGRFDKQQLQRGLQVYVEVCASCHGLDLKSFRNFQDLGYSEDQVKVIAEDWPFPVVDGPNEDGDMFERAAIPSDRIPNPYPNEPFARLVNNGALPPDLSLMAKARKGGPDYIYSLLMLYKEEPPEDVDLGMGMYYNTAFSGNQIAMAPPLFDDLLEYADGTEATMSQMSKDVSAFLMWTAEPKLEARKETGFRVLLFTFVFTVLAYFLKRKIWARIEH